MDLSDIAYVHPIAGNALYVRPALIGSQTQDIGIEIEDRFRGLPIDAYCVVVNFEDLDCHLYSPSGSAMTRITLARNPFFVNSYFILSIYKLFS
jgi:hypothetical protein